MSVEIACCGRFHPVVDVPWTCATCGLTHLGAAPPTFLWRVQEHLAERAGQVRSLQDEIVARKHAIRALEQQQAVLNQYLTLLDELEEGEACAAAPAAA